MTVTQLGALSNGLTSRTKKMTGSSCLGRSSEVPKFLEVIDRKGLSYPHALCGRHLSAKHGISLSPLVSPLRKRTFPVVSNKLSSDYHVGSDDVEETIELKKDHSLSSLKEGVYELNGVPTSQSRPQGVKRELIMLSLPAIVGQAIDPLAQLMETAYIGRLGPVELASAGVGISIFNIISKLFNIPLLSIATSFVAEDIAKNEIKDSTSELGCQERSTNGKPYSGVVERKQLSSVSTALLLAVGIGIFEAFALYLGSGQFLDLMGISSASPMRVPAQQFLKLRALGAPAVVVSLALQGVFRGFKDTKTPVLCLGIGNFLAVILFPLLMYYFKLGVVGAAISTVLSQYIVAFAMIWLLNKRAVLLPPKMGDLEFGGYIKSGGFLLGRTLVVLMTMTLATSMAARQGAVAMAGHQICLQVWLAVSLLTDALATSGQTIIASSVSKGDFKTVKEVTNFVLQVGIFTGVSLAAILGLSFGSLATLFTQDAEVLGVVRSGILFVSASQPINALAYIFDGLHYGVSDFKYAAVSMMASGAISSAFLLYAPSKFGLPGVWLGLTLLMGLRMVGGYIRLLSKTGPWWFLHRESREPSLSVEMGTM